VIEPPLAESWVIDVHEALAGFRRVGLGQLVPGDGSWTLVLTTLHSPPEPDLVEAIRVALDPLLDRADSPLGAREDGQTAATWHFYPATSDGERELLARLEWSRAVVVHERTD